MLIVGALQDGLPKLAEGGGESCELKARVAEALDVRIVEVLEARSLPLVEPLLICLRRDEWEVCGDESRLEEDEQLQHYHGAEGTQQLTSALRFKNLSFAIGASRLVLEMDRIASFGDGSGPSPPPPPQAGYKAQIMKSTDGGETWTTLFMDTGNFYL